MICSERMPVNSPVALLYSEDTNGTLGSFGIVFDEKTVLTTSLIFVSLENGEIDLDYYNNLGKRLNNEDKYIVTKDDLDSPPVCQRVIGAPALEKDIIDKLIEYKSKYLRIINKGDNITEKDVQTFFTESKKDNKAIKKMIKHKHELSIQDFLHEIIANIDYNVLVELERFEYQMVLDYPYIHLQSKIDGMKTLKTPVTNIFTKNFAKLLGESISKSPAVRAMLGLKLIPNKYEL